MCGKELTGKQRKFCSRACNNGPRLHDACVICGGVLPFGQRSYCSTSCTREGIKRRRSVFSYKLGHYKSNAKKRGLKWRLSKEEFAELWQQPCHYCGSSIDSIGLDRVDSSRGYSRDNVVPCCFMCNRMKSDLPTDVWMDHMEKVLNYQQETRDV